ncbi:MAG: lytic transglycosylase domain-containing protein [Streptosporangiales bacterium]|nr:lytic transglycosylase domain-containing protein [Streptosporangiales bacterium]MBO0890572.1 lytic transglycosylase domain-containing protein [Acidothermales bacterium]
MLGRLPVARVRLVVIVAVACVVTAVVGVVALVGGVGTRDAGAGDANTHVASPSPIPGSASTGATPSMSTGPEVAPLRRVVAPDLIVVSPKTIPPGTAGRVAHLRGVTETVRVEAGSVKVGSGRATLLGVDPSTFRAWTPLASAQSDDLWRALAYDQLVLTFDARQATSLTLGQTYPVTAERALPLRLGGVAALDLPHVDGLVTATTGHALGLSDGAAMLVNAPAANVAALATSVRKTMGTGAKVVPLRDPPPESSNTKPPTGRPTTYRELYTQAASRCPGLSWTVLAAIGQVESGHGRNMGPSSAGALGPMQFLPSTWSRYGVDGNGDGKANIWDPYDAVPAAADYLCESGAGRGGKALYDAIFAYNHSDTYVRNVLAIAAAYAKGG